jgi:hypothetical protein
MFEMEPLEAIAHRLLDPTIAYLLFVLGLYACSWSSLTRARLCQARSGWCA